MWLNFGQFRPCAHMHLVARAHFWHCPRMSSNADINARAAPIAPIAIAGTGNAARVTALALAAAGLPVAIEPQIEPQIEQQSKSDAGDKTHGARDDWQSVLALSPAARLMLDALGVWAMLDLPSTPILDMHVFGRPSAINDAVGDDDAFLSPRLGFAAPPPNSDKSNGGGNGGGEKTDNAFNAAMPLGHMVSLAALGRALAARLRAEIEAGVITVLPAALQDYDAASKTVTLEGGAAQPVALLVDSCRSAPKWRARDAARPLRHDYQAAALVGRVRASRPHGQLAAQIFLPDGPLALLPLPQPHELALVWSLPRAKARALASATPDIVAHELDAATQGRFGTLHPAGHMATQDLHLALAQDMVGPAYVALGDAAHVVHPLAGQGFNLSLRDAAALADALYEARALGLPLDDAAMLGDYATIRRADAAVTASATHGLAHLFQGPLAPLGRLGLGLVGRLAEKRPGWRAVFTAQANRGIGGDTAPRLMRGVLFD